MKRPNGYREPTDEEMRCLPEGTLTYYHKEKAWRPSHFIGKDIGPFRLSDYAVPATRKPLFLRPARNTPLEEGMAMHKAIAALPEILEAMEQQLDPLIPQEAKTKALKLAMEKAGYTFP